MYPRISSLIHGRRLFPSSAWGNGCETNHGPGVFSRRHSRQRAALLYTQYMRPATSKSPPLPHLNQSDVKTPMLPPCKSLQDSDAPDAISAVTAQDEGEKSAQIPPSPSCRNLEMTAWLRQLTTPPKSHSGQLRPEFRGTVSFWATT